ncbi:hypothetical protein ACVWW6_000385 [Bradyrhizobium sp. USDA 3311]
MSRSRSRVCLQDGLKLDINRLARNSFVKFGANIGVKGIAWNHSYWGEIAQGLISADMTDAHRAWLKVELGDFAQRITLVSRFRHFGGHQWYFLCPATHRLAAVLWKPPGALRFCSRQTWGRQVAYASQFLDRDSRAHYARSKLNSRLSLIGGFDPGDWDFPPKPKWMRWKTYGRYETRFERYEAILDQGCASLVAKLLRQKGL